MPGNPERLDLTVLTSLQPGLARLMPEIGARMWKAYYAAEAGNWPLARWQLNEMIKLFRLGNVTRPKYADDINSFINDDLLALMRAVDARDFPIFQKRYKKAVESANDFHGKWEKPWIVWKLPDAPPPDLDLTPREP